MWRMRRPLLTEYAAIVALRALLPYPQEKTHGGEARGMAKDGFTRKGTTPETVAKEVNAE